MVLGWGKVNPFYHFQSSRKIKCLLTIAYCAYLCNEKDLAVRWHLGEIPLLMNTF